jgi:F-box/leucine-rich repeat protein 2/20
VKLFGWVDGFYGLVISDIRLTILAQGCRWLVWLELCSCEGSYEGIKAIGSAARCSRKDHRMDAEWWRNEKSRNNEKRWLNGGLRK